jgi:hypothetical protein
MAFGLVVREVFDEHSQGDVITDPVQVAAILADARAHSVTRYAIPATPADPAQIAHLTAEVAEAESALAAAEHQGA